MSHEYIGMTNFLLVIFGLIVVIAVILSRMIVNHASSFFRFLSQMTDNFEGPTELIIKIVRGFALQNVFDWILSILDAYRYRRTITYGRGKSSITYGHGTTIVLSMLIIVFYPDDLLVDEWIAITLFTIILFEKLYIIFRIRRVIHRTHQFKEIASKYTSKGQLSMAILQYGKALNLYQKPFLVKNKLLDIDRAHLIEEIAILLQQQGLLDKAVARYRQALKIYQKPHLCRISDLDDERMSLEEKIQAIQLQKWLAQPRSRKNRKKWDYAEL